MINDLYKLNRAKNCMIINNLKNLLEERNISAYRLSKMAGITPGNVKEIVNSPSLIPRYRALDGICKSLEVNIDDVLKFVPNRIDTRSNKSMQKSSRLTQNYFTNEDYTIFDVQRRHEEMQEMLIY